MVFKYPKKNECKFLKFDIVNFYPSITEELLTASIDFALEHMEISDETINIITHARKSLLFNPQGETWTKKSGSRFDVTMGSFEGAEVCELVGLFILHQIFQVITSIAIGLHRDDGLAILQNASRPGAERIKNNILKTFQQHGLQVTAEANLIETDFLDITLNLSSGKFWPYRKPNNHPLYIQAASNHPTITKKQLLSMITKRVSEISYNKDEYSKKRSRCTTKPSKTAAKRIVSPFSRSNRKGKAELERETWYGSTPLSATTSKPTLARSFLGFCLSTFQATARFAKFVIKTT